jgi:hypothetical protein
MEMQGWHMNGEGKRATGGRFGMEANKALDLRGSPVRLPYDSKLVIASAWAKHGKTLVGGQGQKLKLGWVFVELNRPMLIAEIEKIGVMSRICRSIGVSCCGDSP